MRTLRQLFLGSAAALLSLALVFGSFSMALTEGGMVQAMLQSLTPPAFVPGTILPSLTEPPPVDTPLVSPQETLPPLEFPTSTGTATLTATEPSPPSGVECPPPPQGWSRIIVQVGDSLESLAQAYGTSKEILRQVNCLVVDTIVPDTTLFVPGIPTETPVACGPPRGWVFYVIQPGDTLIKLAQMFGVSVYDLQVANCIVGQDLIRWGTRLYVPFLPSPTRAPTLTATQIASPTLAPSLTSTLPPTRTATPVPVFTSSPTSPPEPTNTLTHTPTMTASSTDTATPTLTLMPTLTPTWTLTATEAISGTIP